MTLTPDTLTLQMAQAKEAFNKRDYNQSITLLTNIIQKNPDYAEAYMELGSIWMRSNTPDKALPYLEKAIELVPDDLIYLWEYAKFLVVLKQEEKALIQYDHLVSSGKREIPIEAISEWLKLTQEYGSLDLDIREKVKNLSLNNPTHPMFKFLYAQSCVAKLDKEKALALFDEVYQLDPDNIAMLGKLSGAYAGLGLKDKSTEYLQRILTIEPLNFAAWVSIGQNHTFSYGDSVFRQFNLMEAHFDKMPAEERAKLHFALGKAYDDVNDLATAFEHYKLGGRSRSQGKHIVEYQTLKNYRISIEKYLTKDIFEREQEKGCTSNKPIFILGMPRSGTSLMEQVLSSIDHVYGAGELTYSMDILNQIEVNQHKFHLTNKRASFQESQSSDYKDRGEHYLKLIEALAPSDSNFIIDKLPGNFQFVGLLHLILPNASIIHSRRHPVEICLSAYRLHFANGLHWSDDLETMGKYYREYHEIIKHWKNILPEKTILDVHYEDMVTNLERESKRITEHIGIEWDASCLEFYTHQRVVHTASLSQVRQPIYKTSMNRWHKYEPYLKPLLDEIGDLVEEYEMELEIRN